MARVITDTGVDLGDVTDAGALAYYRREPGFVVNGVKVGTGAVVTAADDDSPTVEVPAVSANKPEWIDYALAVDPGNAEWINDSSTTKDDLIAKYGE